MKKLVSVIIALVVSGAIGYGLLLLLGLMGGMSGALLGLLLLPFVWIFLFLFIYRFFQSKNVAYEQEGSHFLQKRISAVWPTIIVILFLFFLYALFNIIY